MATGRMKLYTALLALGVMVALQGAGPIERTSAQPAAASVSSIPLTGTWTIDPNHTNINFAVQHFGISTVRGRFDDFSGTIVADAAHPEKSSVQFTINAKSINTDVAMRDNDLRSKNYFDVSQYPQITFQSTKIEKRKNGAYIAEGPLTMHGVSKVIDLPFTIKGPIKDAFGGTRFGLVTEVHVNRQDFGVGSNNTLANGDFAVGNDVDITISLEAVAQKK